MSARNRFRSIGIAVAVLAGANAALAQHNLARTITVDPTLNAADHRTIQAAINDSRIGSNPPVRFTVLIYAGTYTEAVTLGDTKENVDLVGVDRDAVIIKPPADSDGITIQGDGARNNTIRNLTIITDDDDFGQGRGIVIKEQTTNGNPSAIRIIDVTIKCDGEMSAGVKVEDAAEDIEISNVRIECTDHTAHGIDAAPSSDLRISNTTMLLEDGHGVIAGDACRISNSSIIIDSAFGDPSATADDTFAIKAAGTTGLRVLGCTLEGRLGGIWLANNVTDVFVADCELRGSHHGVLLECGDDVLFQSCSILADSAKGGKLILPPPPDYDGVHLKDLTGPDVCDLGSIRFIGCTIEARSARDLTNANAVILKAAPVAADGPVQFIGCALKSTTTGDGEKSFGVVSEEAEAVALIGGSVRSSDSDEREEDQFDLSNGTVSGTAIRVRGTRFSKWKGPISAAGTPSSIVQRTIDVDAPSDTAILNAKALTCIEQPNVLPENQPDVYRVLSVKGNQAGMTQPVYIIGSDWAGNDIADKIMLSGTSPVNGVKPFKTVTKIILPAQSGPLQTVSVGTTSELGLYFPISAAADVLQQGRKASGVNSYTLESIEDDMVDATYATVDVGTISANDSFEWAVLGSN